MRHFLIVSLAVCCGVSMVSCVAGEHDPAADLETWDDEHFGHDHFADEENWAEDELDPNADERAVKAATCDTRWSMPDSTARLGAQQNVTYHSAGSRCSSGATQGARDLGNYIRDNFGNLMNLSVLGRGVQIYNCRQVNGGSSLSVHSVGRAVDIFIPTRGSNADNAKGDQIANWLVENAEFIGVQMIIWDRTIWTANRTPQSRCYTGRHPHNDHIHIELTRDGGSKATGFFRALDRGEEPDPNVSEPPAPQTWIGSTCQSNTDCNFAHNGVSGECFVEHGPADGRGFCTMPCEGYCPDRGGFATTFCAATDDLGTGAGRGRCAARSSSLNSGCQEVPGTEARNADRHIGRSGAPSARQTICAPVVVQRPEPQPDPEPEVITEPDPEPTPEPGDNNGICEDPALPLSENGDACQGNEQWRCACSDRLDTSISQVCRNGRWLNYQTNPRDCSQCNGAYSNACEPGPPPVPQGNNICTDRSLPLSENRDSCQGFSENQWRCACSDRLDSTVSQVCRSGRWLNYETNPRDCGRCDGRYTSGCEGR